MQKLQHLSLAFLVAALMALPAAAQKGAKGERNNNSAGKQHGKARAEQVQVENKKGEKDPSPSKGSKSQGKHKGWSTKGEHKAKGHR